MDIIKRKNTLEKGCKTNLKFHHFLVFSVNYPFTLTLNLYNVQFNTAVIVVGNLKSQWSKTKGKVPYNWLEIKNFHHYLD